MLLLPATCAGANGGGVHVVFPVNFELLDEARTRLRALELFWLMGGSGSGKSTLSRELRREDRLIVDMDEKIYGSFHARFDPVRHPTNHAWSSATSSLDFLLSMPWSEFDAFHRSALVEYLDLLADDLASHRGIIIVDGGAWHPSVLLGALPAERLVCIEAPWQDSVEVWQGNPGRFEMRTYMNALAAPDAAWATFLEFDTAITETIARECRELGVEVLTRDRTTTVDVLLATLVARFGLD